MENLPHDWLALAGVVFMLGLRHGLDADHLAAIDGMTRHNWSRNPRLARCCGALFSLGHGAVVMAVATAVALASSRFALPAWLGETGALVSIAVLGLLGIINMRALLTTPTDRPVAPVGLRSRWFRFGASRPLAVAGVGLLFALSFDTISQASLFAFAAGRFGGPAHALALALVFTLGMLMADGVNGLWIARLLRGADRRARIASRVMAFAVASISLLVAGLGALRYLSPTARAWGEGRELTFGVAVLALIALSYLVARRLSPQPALGTR